MFPGPEMVGFFSKCMVGEAAATTLQVMPAARYSVGMVPSVQIFCWYCT
jgi:hypothetical protein